MSTPAFLAVILSCLAILTVAVAQLVRRDDDDNDLEIP